MTEIDRVLVHPHQFFNNDAIGRRWSEWEQRPETFVIPSGDYQGLWDATILSLVDKSSGRFVVGDTLLIGGQETHLCVWVFLDTLVRHARIQKMDVKLSLDSKAVLPSKASYIDKTIKRIYDTWKVEINCI